MLNVSHTFTNKQCQFFLYKSTENLTCSSHCLWPGLSTPHPCFRKQRIINLSPPALSDSTAHMRRPRLESAHAQTSPDALCFIPPRGKVTSQRNDSIKVPQRNGGGMAAGAKSPGAKVKPRVALLAPSYFLVCGLSDSLIVNKRMKSEAPLSAHFSF